VMLRKIQRKERQSHRGCHLLVSRLHKGLLGAPLLRWRQPRPLSAAAEGCRKRRPAQEGASQKQCYYLGLLQNCDLGSAVDVAACAASSAAPRGAAMRWGLSASYVTVRPYAMPAM
jgi:hypothetical protein